MASSKILFAERRVEEFEQKDGVNEKTRKTFGRRRWVVQDEGSHRDLFYHPRSAENGIRNKTFMEQVCIEKFNYFMTKILKPLAGGGGGWFKRIRLLRTLPHHANNFMKVHLLYNF